MQAKLNAESLPTEDALKLFLSTAAKPSSESPESRMTELVTQELTECYVQTGLRSKCGVAIIGKHGQFFLHGGSNNVDELFYDDEIHLEKAPNWLARFAERQNKSILAGYQYLQFVIPEKQSLLGDCYYRDISGSSQLLQEIEKTELKSYFSVLQGLSKYSNEDLFFKTDSHLSPQGTYLLFKMLMEQLGNLIEDNSKFTIPHHKSGDLSRKYSPIYFGEVFHVTANVIKCNRKIENKFTPENKAHIGSHIHWINSSAPINKKVLIFGNSFCDLGTRQHHLIWWFSHYFSECQFVWSIDFNDKLIEEFHPDIVIGQSIERFLRLVPTS